MPTLNFLKGIGAAFFAVFMCIFLGIVLGISYFFSNKDGRILEFIFKPIAFFVERLPLNKRNKLIYQQINSMK